MKRLNVIEEIDKLKQIVNDAEFHKKITALSKFSSKDFLIGIFGVTREYDCVEPYLKDSLKKFSLDELENFKYDDYSILHCMMLEPHVISLNSFQMVINYGININKRTRNDETPLHVLMSNNCDNYDNVGDIVDLLINNGADLNAINNNGNTPLDDIMEYVSFNERDKIYIMRLIDAGARSNYCQIKINKPLHEQHIINEVVMKFVQSYMTTKIKVAIKKIKIVSD